MKKISKKLIAMVMSIVLLVSIMPITALAATTVDSGSCGDHLRWSLDSDGVLTISGEGGMFVYDESYPEWFDHVEEITSIVIKEGVTDIGHYAFYLHYNVTDVTIPSTVTAINDYAFGYCVSLEEVTLPSGLKAISEGAFSFCTSLSEMKIPANVINIGNFAFTECYSIEAFEVASGNNNYSSDSRGVLFDKDKTVLMSAPAGLMESYDIPNTVTKIDSFAFTNSLGLEKLTIPASVEEIGLGAILGTASLAEMTASENNQYFSTDNNVLLNKEKTELYCAAGGITGSYTIPDSVGVIYPYAFATCMELTEVIIPEGVTEIGEAAFTTSGIAAVTIPKSVTVIGDGAFSGCENLSIVRFNGAAPAMGELTFETVVADVYYPAGEDSWTDDVLQDYGGDLSWFEEQPSIPDTEIKGDVDNSGDITNADLVMTARYIVGLYDAGSEEAEIIASLGDMDEDGNITNSDLIALARIIVGL